jgi:hypothetical protein
MSAVKFEKGDFKTLADMNELRIENLEEKVPGVYKALPRDEYDEVNAQELLNIYN